MDNTQQSIGPGYASLHFTRPRGTLLYLYTKLYCKFNNLLLIYFLQGGAIQANIKPREKSRFNTLEIDKTYQIKGFGFQDATGWMQTVQNPLSLAFGNNTDIQPLPDIGFPSHYFNFVPYSELHQKVDKKEGLLTGTES